MARVTDDKWLLFLAVFFNFDPLVFWWYLPHTTIAVPYGTGIADCNIKCENVRCHHSSFYNKPIDDDVVKADGKIGNSVAFRFNLSHVQFRKKW